MIDVIQKRSYAGPILLLVQRPLGRLVGARSSLVYMIERCVSLFPAGGVCGALPVTERRAGEKRVDHGLRTMCVRLH